MKTFAKTLIPGMMTLGMLAGANADAPTIPVHQYDAVHIVMQDPLNVRNDRIGDHFTAKVDKDPLLPNGTLLFGQIIDIQYPWRGHPAGMSLQFTQAQLPNGVITPIVAIPMATNDPHLVRDANGRLMAKYQPGTQAADTFAGAAAGLVIGGIGHRPVRGAIFGAIIGSLIGASNRHANIDVIANKGDKMVAVFERDALIGAPGPGGWHDSEGSVPPINVGGPIDVRYEGHSIDFGLTLPYQDARRVMVPLDRTAKLLDLGLDVARHDNGQITIQSPDTSLTLSLDSPSFTLNGETGQLPRPVVVRNGIVYVPVEIFAAFTPERITVNGNAVVFPAS